MRELKTQEVLLYLLWKEYLRQDSGIVFKAWLEQEGFFEDPRELSGYEELMAKYNLK